MTYSTFEVSKPRVEASGYPFHTTQSEHFLFIVRTEERDDAGSLESSSFTSYKRTATKFWSWAVEKGKIPFDFGSDKEMESAIAFMKQKIEKEGQSIQVAKNLHAWCKLRHDGANVVGWPSSPRWTRTLKELKKKDATRKADVVRAVLAVDQFMCLVVSALMSEMRMYARVFWISFMGEVRQDYFETGIPRADLWVSPTPSSIRISIYGLKTDRSTLDLHYVTVPGFREEAIQWITERKAQVEAAGDIFKWSTPLLVNYSPEKARMLLSRFLDTNGIALEEERGLRMLRKSGTLAKDLMGISTDARKLNGVWTKESRAFQENYNVITGLPESQLHAAAVNVVSSDIEKRKRAQRPANEKVARALTLRLALLEREANHRRVDPAFFPPAILDVPELFGRYSSFAISHPLVIEFPKWRSSSIIPLATPSVNRLPCEESDEDCTLAELLGVEVERTNPVEAASTPAPDNEDPRDGRGAVFLSQEVIESLASYVAHGDEILVIWSSDEEIMTWLGFVKVEGDHKTAFYTHESDGKVVVPMLTADTATPGYKDVDFPPVDVDVINLALVKNLSSLERARRDSGRASFPLDEVKCFEYGLDSDSDSDSGSDQDQYPDRKREKK